MDETFHDKPEAIFESKRKSPDQIPEFMNTKPIGRQNGQVPKKALPFSLYNCLSMLLTSLLLVGIWVAPGGAEECDENCTPCHGNSEVVHGNFNHTATLGSGPVVIFPDTSHDNAGWSGEQPYFDVTVDCNICHSTELAAIHGNNCNTCHPSPYDTLGTWDKGCQQGGCHTVYHVDSAKAHLPFSDPIQSAENDCSRCHDPYWSVPQTKCQNCHAIYGPGDVTPPVTTVVTQPTYVGAAIIDFSITDNGKVGVGRTFYQLDGGPETAAGKNLLITTPGMHQLNFWSMDQSGNTEPVTKHTSFTIEADTTPPTTTSNAIATYNQGAVINLSATDASTLGVKTIYYRLGDGPVQTGSMVVIPATTGTFTYRLYFWADDWSENTESEKSVDFTVTSGLRTLSLSWGNSDQSGSPCDDEPGAEASWTISQSIMIGNKRVVTTVAAGSDGCPDWSGVNQITVPVSPTPYTVLIDWYDSYSEDWDQTSFQSVNVSTPGPAIRLSY